MNMNANHNDACKHAVEDAFAGQNLSFGITVGYDAESFERVFQINDDRFRHTLVLGRTGSGKSNHVQRMEREDIQNGTGCFILAAHEDDALYALSCMPEWRMGDVVLLDFANPEFLPIMNPLDVDPHDQAAVDRAVEDVIELTRLDNYYQFAGPRFEEMVRNGLLLLLSSPLDKDRCIANLARVYSDPEYTKDLLKYCTNRRVHDHWTKVIPEEKRSSDSGEVTHWFIGKVARFATDSTLAHVFGPGRRTFDVADVVDGGKVLVAYIPEDRIGAIAARVIAKSLVMQLRDAIMNRGTRGGGWRGLTYGLYEGGSRQDGSFEPFFAYVDEFAKFATTDFERLLAEARKQSVGFVLSTQTLSQTHTFDVQTGMQGKLEETILGNVGSFVCYPVGELDAWTMARQLDVEEERLRRIRRYRPVARLCVGNQATEPMELAVSRRPEPDNPSAPRRIARAMVADGTWVPVRNAANKGVFQQMIADPGEKGGAREAAKGGSLKATGLGISSERAASPDKATASGDQIPPDGHPLLSLDTKLFEDETFDFCVRTCRCLSRVGITDLGKLLDLSEEELAGIEGITPRCVREVKGKLASYGLSLRADD